MGKTLSYVGLLTNPQTKQNHDVPQGPEIETQTAMNHVNKEMGQPFTKLIVMDVNLNDLMMLKEKTHSQEDPRACNSGIWETEMWENIVYSHC